MKVLVSSNSPWCGSGYGTQSNIIVRTLQALGHEVAVFAWYGLEGSTLQIDGIKVYPRVGHAYGGDAWLPAVDWGADLVITVQDIWVLPEEFRQSLPVPWLAYFPVDGDPMPPMIENRVREADYPVVYSQYGCQVLSEAGIAHWFVPCGLDTEVFKPGDKQQARQDLGLPEDKYIVLMVAQNKGYPPRKSFPEALQAFKSFHEQVPDSVLYLHTRQDAAPGHGVQIGRLLDVLEMRDMTLFTGRPQYLLGLKEERLAKLYQAADCLLAPSMAEGFGLPIAEAQLCGVPVITTAVTSMPEITVNGISCEPLQRFWSPLNHWQWIPSIERITAALLDIYNWTPQERMMMAAKGLQHFQSHYAKEHVAVNYWKPLLDHIEANTDRKEQEAAVKVFQEVA